MPALAHVASEKLAALAEKGRLRRLVETRRLEGPYVERVSADGMPRKLVCFSSNDYLALSRHPDVEKAAMLAAMGRGAGAGASRLVTGNHPAYAGLEALLAQWKGTEASLVFGSGYLTNLGVISALMGREDLILADRLAHACILDGARLSGAKLLRFAHNDAQDCARLLAAHRGQHRHALIVTEEVFSMDGDLAPLPALRALADAHDAWLMADGAHSLSVRPTVADIYVGTFSKTLGAYGGFVAAQKPVIDLLAATARSLIFSTALPPATVEAASAALRLLLARPEMAEVPLRLARLFTQWMELREAASPIVPVIVGDDEAALTAQRMLEEAGFLAVAIRPPTVPEGTARLRFTFCADHSDAQVRELAVALTRIISDIA